jgi:glycosyltransferase involved in cell wall biosynthesis
MKILIVTSLVGSWPYMPEMLEELEKRGHHLESFDIRDLGPMGLSAKLAFKVQKLQYPTTVSLLKRRLALLPADFDAVNIHFAEPIYRDLARDLKRRGKKLITTIWGSDFLRAGPSARRDLGRTFDASDIITVNNPEILREIVAYYPSISDRARVVPFGLRSLDVITALQQSESQEETRKKLDLPLEKLIVACGHNAIPEQRHTMMIEAFAPLSPTAKSRLFALIPMTYPDDQAYREQMRRSLEATNVEYRILDEKMSIEDVCRVRIASDFVVNIQTTDSLSASIQEHIFAGSSMIVGKWLPYNIFEKWGAQLHKVESVNDIAAALEKAARGAEIGRRTRSCADRIYDYSSWSANARRWLQLYGECRNAVDLPH